MATAPHAYSSDTLQKAYQWLQDNPQYQESVHNSDQLVALYLSEKKGLQSFDFSPPTSASLFLNQTNNKPSIDNIYKEPVNTKTMASSTIVQNSTVQKKTNTTDSFFALDKKSLSYLEDTKKTFNLSTQAEALRLLLSIGYEKLHKL